ncbi:MAG: hypothetical protein AAGM67_09105 [Bacteroidota bacterium]
MTNIILEDLRAKAPGFWDEMVTTLGVVDPYRLLGKALTHLIPLRHGPDASANLSSLSLSKEHFPDRIAALYDAYDSVENPIENAILQVASLIAEAQLFCEEAEMGNMQAFSYLKNHLLLHVRSKLRELNEDGIPSEIVSYYKALMKSIRAFDPKSLSSIYLGMTYRE